MCSVKYVYLLVIALLVIYINFEYTRFMSHYETLVSILQMLEKSKGCI